MNSKIVGSHPGNGFGGCSGTAGFADFTARTAWRHGPARIDVFAFQSFNASTADVQLRRLRKENSELRMEREIPKERDAFFAKENR